MTKSKFTQKDAKQLEMPLQLLKLWEYYMNALWRILNDRYICTSKDNCIYIGGTEIGVQFVNKSYLCLQITDVTGVQILTYRIKNLQPLLDITLTTLKFES